MKTFSVYDKAIMLVLTKKEAKALKERLGMVSGYIKTVPLLKVEEKLLVELGEL